MLLGKRAQRLGEHGVLGNSQRQFAAPGDEGVSLYSDHVSEVKLQELRHPPLAQLVDPGLKLDAA